jgi:putative phage-type endonuclease
MHDTGAAQNLPYIEEPLDSREEWLKKRRTGLGSSDAAIVMGLSEFDKGLFELYVEKHYKDVALSNEDNHFLRTGRQLEPIIADNYVLDTGRALKDLGQWTIRRSRRYPWMICTHDRLIEAVDERGVGVLSMKTVLARFGHARAAWEDLLRAKDPHQLHELKDAIRLDYQAQLQHELVVSDLRWGELAVWFADRPLLVVPFERNEKFCEELIEAERSFWIDNVVAGVEPPIDGSDGAERAVKALYSERDDRKVIELAKDDPFHELVAERVYLKKLLGDSEKRLKVVENEMRQHAKDAAVVRLNDGSAIEFNKRHRDGYTVEPGEYVEMRLKKPKALAARRRG